MGDFGAPATGNIQAPEGLKALGDVMSLRQKSQALQSGALEIQRQQAGLIGQQSQNQSAAATAQMDTQSAAQKSAAGKFFQNFDLSKHVKDDGTLDLDSALTSPEFKATGSDAPEIAQHLMGIKNSQIQAKTGLANLNSNLRGQFQQTVGGLADDADVKSGNNAGKGKILDSIQQFADSGGPDAARVASIYTPVIQNAPPAKLGAVLKNINLQAMSADQQASQTNPEGVAVNSGNATQFGSRDKISGKVTMGAGPPVMNQLTPQDRMPKITTNAAGQAVAINPVNPNQAGIVGSGRAPTAGGGGPVAPGAGPAGPAGRSGQRPNTGPMSVPSSQDVNPTSANVAATMDNTKVASQNIEQARQVGDQAPLNQHINDQLLKLSEDTSTGYGTKDWHKAIGAISGGKFGGDYQTIGAYLDRQSAMAAKSMGLPDTNAGLATAQGATGSTEYSRAALQTKVKLADTLNTAAKQYRQGLDKVVGVSGNPDTAQYQKYRAAWSQNFDPQVFAAQNALRRGDTDELKKIQSEGPKRMAELQQKTLALKALANGQLPQ